MSAGDIVGGVTIKLRRHTYAHDVISPEAAGEMAAFVLSNTSCRVKPAGLLSLISEGFVSRSIRCF